MTHAEAIEIIHSGGPCVRLLIRRGTRVPQLPSEGKYCSAYLFRHNTVMYLNLIEEMFASANVHSSLINLDNKMNMSHSVSSLQSNSRPTYWDTKYMCSS